jgi:hypothetical protein
MGAPVCAVPPGIVTGSWYTGAVGILPMPTPTPTPMPPPPPWCGSGKVFVGLVTVVGVTAWLLTGAVGLAKDPGMVGAETEFMTGTGDGIVVGVVRSGMVLSVGSGTMVGSRTPCPGWSTAR